MGPGRHVGSRCSKDPRRWPIRDLLLDPLRLPCPFLCLSHSHHEGASGRHGRGAVARARGRQPRNGRPAAGACVHSSFSCDTKLMHAGRASAARWLPGFVIGPEACFAVCLQGGTGVELAMPPLVSAWVPCAQRLKVKARLLVFVGGEGCGPAAHERAACCLAYLALLIPACCRAGGGRSWRPTLRPCGA